MRFNYRAIYAVLEPLTASSTPAADAVAIVRRLETLQRDAKAAKDSYSARIYAAVEAEGGPLLNRGWPFYRVVTATRHGIGNRLEAHELNRVPRDRDVRKILRHIQRKTVVSST